MKLFIVMLFDLLLCHGSHIEIRPNYRHTGDRFKSSSKPNKHKSQVNIKLSEYKHDVLTKNCGYVFTELLRVEFCTQVLKIS